MNEHNAASFRHDLASIRSGLPALREIAAKRARVTSRQTGHGSRTVAPIPLNLGAWSLLQDILTLVEHMSRVLGLPMRMDAEGQLKGIIPHADKLLSRSDAPAIVELTSQAARRLERQLTPPPERKMIGRCPHMHDGPVVRRGRPGLRLDGMRAMRRHAARARRATGQRAQGRDQGRAGHRRRYQPTAQTMGHRRQAQDHQRMAPEKHHPARRHTGRQTRLPGLGRMARMDQTRSDRGRYLTNPTVAGNTTTVGHFHRRWRMTRDPSRSRRHGWHL